MVGKSRMKPYFEKLKRLTLDDFSAISGKKFGFSMYFFNFLSDESGMLSWKQ